MNFTLFHWLLLGFIWFYWVLLGFTGFYWVLLGFTGFLKRVHQMVTRKYVGGGFSWIPNAHLRPSISSTKSSFFGRVWHWSSWKKERGRGKGREGVRGKRGGGRGGPRGRCWGCRAPPQVQSLNSCPTATGSWFLRSFFLFLWFWLFLKIISTFIFFPPFFDLKMGRGDVDGCVGGGRGA